MEICGPQEQHYPLCKVTPIKLLSIGTYTEKYLECLPNTRLPHGFFQISLVLFICPSHPSMSPFRPFPSSCPVSMEHLTQQLQLQIASCLGMGLCVSISPFSELAFYLVQICASFGVLLQSLFLHVCISAVAPGRCSSWRHPPPLALTLSVSSSLGSVVFNLWVPPFSGVAYQITCISDIYVTIYNSSEIGYEVGTK